jgi:hypothetical protein
LQARVVRYTDDTRQPRFSSVLSSNFIVCHFLLPLIPPSISFLFPHFLFYFVSFSFSRFLRLFLKLFISSSHSPLSL